MDTLSNKQSAGNDRIPFVVTFHPVLPNIGEILHRLHPILQSSSRCREAVGGVPMVTFRRPKCERTFWFTQNLRHRLRIRVVLSVQIKDAGFVIILLKVPDLLVELLARVT